MTQYCFCPFCLMPLAKLKNDRKGRPYSSCENCGQRTFLKTQQAYEGFLRMSNRARADAGPEIMKRVAERMAAIEKAGPISPAPTFKEEKVKDEQPAK